MLTMKPKMTVDMKAPKNPSQVLLGESLISRVRPKKNPKEKGNKEKSSGKEKLFIHYYSPKRYAMISLHITIETGRRNQKGASKMFCMMRYAWEPNMNMVRCVHANCRMGSS